ncbi:MAG TPA: SDR family NAD(P)-dependent oxidoreductase [Candidatus Limnocylindria bacterium]|nr:SDR family NAD(P)-dependent oxidoreductase [Candidatus Limnocylindria bacterium]
MQGLSSHVAVVTGVTGNLGPAVLRAYLTRGTHVAAAVRDAAKGEALRVALADVAGDADDPRLLVIEADPADASAMDALVERVLRAWGRIDILNNLAGIFKGGPALDAGRMRELWDTNVLTAVTAAAACLRPMRARGYGRVVSVSALTALKGGRNNAAYAMSKGALVRWTESLAAEMKGEGITVNAVLPTTIDHPANRAQMPKADPTLWPSPEEVANVILFLSSREASGVNGAAIPITART